MPPGSPCSLQSGESLKSVRWRSARHPLHFQSPCLCSESTSRHSSSIVRAFFLCIDLPLRPQLGVVSLGGPRSFRDTDIQCAFFSVVLLCGMIYSNVYVQSSVWVSFVSIPAHLLPPACFFGPNLVVYVRGSGSHCGVHAPPGSHSLPTCNAQTHLPPVSTIPMLCPPFVIRPPFAHVLHQVLCSNLHVCVFSSARYQALECSPSFFLQWVAYKHGVSHCLSVCNSVWIYSLLVHCGILLACRRALTWVCKFSCGLLRCLPYFAGELVVAFLCVWTASFVKSWTILSTWERPL